MPERDVRLALSGKEWETLTFRRLRKDMFDRHLTASAASHGHGDVLLAACGVSVADGKTLQETRIYIQPVERPAVAALLLYGTPEGFTQEDVDALRDAICPLGVHDDYDYDRLADKIAALLPPVPPES